MKQYECCKCKYKDLFMEKRGTQTALLCGDCGAWQKWIGANELPLIKRFIETQEKQLTNTDLVNIEIAVYQYMTEYATSEEYQDWELLDEKLTLIIESNKEV